MIGIYKESGEETEIRKLGCGTAMIAVLRTKLMRDNAMAAVRTHRGTKNEDLNTNH